MTYKISAEEREAVRSELVLIAESLIESARAKGIKLSIPEARRQIQEILGVSV